MNKAQAKTKGCTNGPAYTVRRPQTPEITTPPHHPPPPNRSQHPPKEKPDYNLANSILRTKLICVKRSLTGTTRECPLGRRLWVCCLAGGEEWSKDMVLVPQD